MKIDGQQIIRLRKNEELTQSELAELSGLSERTVIRAEKGEISHDSLLSIAAALRIDHKLLLREPVSETPSNEEGNGPTTLEPAASKTLHVEPGAIADANSTRTLVDQYLTLLRPEGFSIPLTSFDIAANGLEGHQTTIDDHHPISEHIHEALKPSRHAPKSDVNKYRSYINDWFEKIEHGSIRFGREKLILTSLIKPALYSLIWPAIIVLGVFFLSPPSSSRIDDMWIINTVAGALYLWLLMRDAKWQYFVALPDRVKVEAL